MDSLAWTGNSFLISRRRCNLEWPTNLTMLSSTRWANYWSVLFKERIPLNRDSNLDEPEFLPREGLRDWRQRNDAQDEGQGEAEYSGQETRVVEQVLVLLGRLNHDRVRQDLEDKPSVKITRLYQSLWTFYSKALFQDSNPLNRVNSKTFTNT